ncbi:alpha/beta hydrolase [Neisseria animalis]|uniref:Alpha/beta fold hydrolase n=1 Tax=Neisseria animalis TaxID=492 RepID=A0A5P3MSW3_NEIAN|nr:alpha/beta hydrolase [Neisseria animalis]QEY24664.1 alpha/beta fold hydrolase [Neisseria animalis]ROW31470.1 alpha/beta fold hydrolase [Neisseria animalis]VEE07589.1 putative hydrolase [Neisseria animalis]
MLNKPDIINISGPAGLLETIYLPAQGQERGVAVINHPNPLQGGTYTNKVIQTAAKALTQLGFHCYLPNLRGVGNSQGTHDYGKGETDDCIAVIDYARAQHPDSPEFALAGFSFGGYVATFAAQQRTPDLLLLLGPAVHHYTNRPEPQAVPDVAKTLLIHGAEDEVVEISKALSWAEPQNLPVITLAGSSHFFHGKLIALRDTILRFAPALLK